MPFANNRAVRQTKATFQAVGGTRVYYSHPILVGQLSGGADRIDVSATLRLNDTFMDANPIIDSSTMEVLVNGDTVTLTNHVMAGEMTLQVLRLSELVGDGDFIAAAHLVIASKDSIGGVIERIKEVKGKTIYTVFYGVGFKRVPHIKEAGNQFVPYPMTLSYGGWVQGISTAESANKIIWAVGNLNKTEPKVYEPYGIQSGGTGSYFTSDDPSIDFKDADGKAIDTVTNTDGKPNFADLYKAPGSSTPPAGG
jgi:hypothetical protein